jgi:hypothetical protein
MMNSKKMLKLFLSIIATIILGKIAFAQDESHLIGDWKGESICQVKNSPCHDEIVVYRISKGKEANAFVVNADKIIDGKPVFMGTLDFAYEKENNAFVCTMKNGTFRLIKTGNKMEGTLITPDKIVYRRISLAKNE